MKIFVCDYDFEAALSCICDAWEYAHAHKEEPISLAMLPVIQESLFDEYIKVEASKERSDKLIQAIKSKLSLDIYETVYMAFLYEKDVLNDIYLYLRLAFKYGKYINNMLQQDVVSRIVHIRNYVSKEIHRFIEFVRFDEFKNSLYISHIEPNNDILYSLSFHFADRMPSLNFIIIDDKRMKALVHKADELCYIQKLHPDELSYLSKSEYMEDEYKSLWKSFFKSIAIKERENLKLQRQLCPLYKRKHMSEFRGT